MNRKDYEVFAGIETESPDGKLLSSEIFSTNVARIKDDKRLSYKAMKSSAPELSKSTASRMVNGQVAGKIDDISKLAKGQGVSIYDLCAENSFHKQVVNNNLPASRDAKWCLNALKNIDDEEVLDEIIKEANLT